MRRAAGPPAANQRSVGGAMLRLHAGRHAEAREARQVVRIDQLSVLDARRERRPAMRRFDGVETGAHGAVADRMNGDR